MAATMKTMMQKNNDKDKLGILLKKQPWIKMSTKLAKDCQRPSSNEEDVWNTKKATTMKLR